MKICPKCQTPHTNDNSFCNVCGTALEDIPSKYCPDCGAVVEFEDALFCDTCGFQFTEERSPLDIKPVYVCRHCGFVVTDREAAYCFNCGSSVENPVDIANNGFEKTYYRICTHCGTTYELNTNTSHMLNCDKCNHPLRESLRDNPTLTAEDMAEVEKKQGGRCPH